MSSLQDTLRRTIKGDVLFDKASRGRYSTDASIYQIEPVGIVVPKDETDLALALDVARDARAAILPRGAGTSQCGQTVGEALVVDFSKYMFDSATPAEEPNQIIEPPNPTVYARKPQS